MTRGNRLDDAADFGTGNHRQGKPVARNASPQPEIEVVERDCLHLDDGFSGRIRLGTLDQLQTVGASMFSNQDCSHSCSNLVGFTAGRAARQLIEESGSHRMVIHAMAHALLKNS